MKITKESLEKDPEHKHSYKLKFVFNGKSLKVNLDPEDLTIEETMALANKILSKIEFYEKRAKDVIVRDFLENYNENWSDDEDGFPILNNEEFRNKLELNSINFGSDHGIDFFYNESGMFGNHFLIAQSFDGENFEYSSMFG